MENAAEALKLGAWVLIFVVALSISMSAFGQAKTTIDAIINASDREYLTSYIPESGDTQRTVGFESIIPNIYRSFKEDYKIVFPEGYVLYRYNDEPINYIDLSINNMTDNVKEEFIKRIIHGTQRRNSDYDSNFTGYTFTYEGIYPQLQGKQFREKLGMYYDQEKEGASDVPDASKTLKRIITYEEI